VWHCPLTNLHPVLGSARLYRQADHQATDLEDQVIRGVQLVRSLIAAQGLLRLLQLLKDLTIKFVCHSTGIFLHQVGCKVPPGILIILNPKVQLGYGIALKISLTGTFDF